MRFDPKTWRCAGCNKVDTLCQKETNVTLFYPVLSVGDIIELAKVPHTIGGKKCGYVCYHCGMEIATTPEELIEQFPGKITSINMVRKRTPNLEGKIYNELLNEFNLLSFSKKQLGEMSLDRLHELLGKIKTILNDW